MASAGKWTTTEHRLQVARLAQQAQEHLSRGELEAASAPINQAFQIVDAHGIQEDVVFIAVVLVAGDANLAIDSCEEAAALYLTAANVAASLDDGSSTDVVSLLARAWLGLARCDVERGGSYAPRAPARYAQVHQYLQRVPNSEAMLAAEVLQEIELGMTSPRGPTER
jgi:hypothetical protein